MFPSAAATLDDSVDIVKCMIWKKRGTRIRKSWLLWTRPLKH